MKVLVADNLDAGAMKELEHAGFEVLQTKGLVADALPKGSDAAEILVVRSTLVPGAVQEGIPGLKLIVRAGAGIDNIDVEAARKRGIQVSNCPGKNADAVAELALGLILAADRNIVQGALYLREGKWKKKELSRTPRGLKDRTLGIIGMGAVGKALAVKARGLEMKVRVYSRSLTAEEAKSLGVESEADMMDLAEKSDVVSAHMSLTPETRGCLNMEFFRRMKNGAIFVNTSRGEVVDRNALLGAIREKGLRAGLDVFAEEPKTPDSAFEDVELASAIVGTPHLGASTEQALEAVGKEVVRIAKVFRDTGEAPNRVFGKED